MIHCFKVKVPVPSGLALIKNARQKNINIKLVENLKELNRNENFENGYSNDESFKI